MPWCVVRGIRLYDVSVSDDPDILVGVVRLTACNGESSAQERLTKSLLFRSQYRTARVILK